MDTLYKISVKNIMFKIVWMHDKMGEKEGERERKREKERERERENKKSRV